MKVYGIFRKGENYTILTGETDSLEKDIIEVEYQGFTHTYQKKEIGLSLFREIWQAEDVLVDLGRMKANTDFTVRR